MNLKIKTATLCPSKFQNKKELRKNKLQKDNWIQVIDILDWTVIKVTLVKVVQDLMDMKDSLPNQINLDPTCKKESLNNLKKIKRISIKILNL